VEKVMAQKSTTSRNAVPRRVWIPALCFAFLLIIFLIAAFFVTPSLTPDQRDLVRLLFSLLAGFASLFLGGAGLLKLGWPTTKPVTLSLSATGGIAVFLFTYLNPPYWHNKSGQNLTLSGDDSPGAITQNVTGNSNTVTQNVIIQGGQENLTPEVPAITLTTNEGLPLSDFPNGTIHSPEIMRHLRRHNLVVENQNNFEIYNFSARIQLPEPIVQSPLIEERPAGVEVLWQPCRMEISLAGTDATATRTEEGSTRLSTGAAPGSSATLYASRLESCSSNASNETLSPTGIYKVQIERLPASSVIRVGFLTSNGPEARRYLSSQQRESDPTILDYFLDGSYQYMSAGQSQTRLIFVPLKFDQEKRVMTSLPSSGESGKWRINLHFFWG
jgi:hypothetical protein